MSFAAAARSRTSAGSEGEPAASTAPDWPRRITAKRWPWLIYLPLYGMPWLSKPPSPPALIASAAGLLLFLAALTWGWRQKGLRRLAAGLIVLLIGFLLAPTGGNWPIIGIYAAALVGELRPATLAIRCVLGFTGVATLFALNLGHLWPWGLLNLFMMVMVGLGSVSQAALEDKNNALALAQDEIRALAATAERERISRDLHDLLGRTLTLVAIKAELAARLVLHDVDRAANEMREVAQASRDALGEVRAAVAGMHCGGLVREIEQAQAALAAAGIACRIAGDPATIEPGNSTVLAMALRESVTNVIRHSGASGCTVTVLENDAEDVILVEDSGDGTAIVEGLGLAGLRARLSAAGGSLVVTSDSKCTRVRASLPRDRGTR